ncbi:hypothetical protein B0T24DRAFT_667365 [Lasiosphaeria ovina]|uniref:Uncharacterized protein n=1 Tax=Lasiosphaeria ovina TaxID=92902 RepID=A0AAE0KCQ5_9PEZI|nr:hypothetical protein B0T24DRAFT_667365 [Lasiosphaeria ovina]
MSRRPVIILSKPIKPRDHKERQRKADEDDEVLAGVDSKRKIWLGLYNDQEREKTRIKSYFRDYTESSRITRPALGDGDDEYQNIQTITITKTAILHWRNLVVEADNTILREKRREDPSKRGLWKLRRSPDLRGPPRTNTFSRSGQISQTNSA